MLENGYYYVYPVEISRNIYSYPIFNNLEPIINSKASEIYDEFAHLFPLNDTFYAYPVYVNGQIMSYPINLNAPVFKYSLVHDCPVNDCNFDESLDNYNQIPSKNYNNDIAKEPLDSKIQQEGPSFWSFALIVFVIQIFCGILICKYSEILYLINLFLYAIFFFLLFFCFFRFSYTLPMESKKQKSKCKKR